MQIFVFCPRLFFYLSLSSFSWEQPDVKGGWKAPFDDLLRFPRWRWWHQGGCCYPGLWPGLPLFQQVEAASLNKDGDSWCWSWCLLEETEPLSFSSLPLGLVASVLSVLHIPGLYKVDQSNVLHHYHQHHHHHHHHHYHHHHRQLYLHQCYDVQHLQLLSLVPLLATVLLVFPTWFTGLSLLG